MPQINGDSDNNWLFGTIGKDDILGLGGNDYLTGIGGHDVLDGGEADDSLRGGTGTGGAPGLTIQATIDRDGFDAFIASLPSDTFTGGGGSDHFVFSAMPSVATVTDPANNSVSTIVFNLDSISDFTSGEDKIVLVASSRPIALGVSFTTDSFWQLPDGSLAPEMLRVVSDTADVHRGADTDDFLIYDSSTGALYYDVDAGGAASPAIVVTLTGAPALVANDFEVIVANTVSGSNEDEILKGTDTIDNLYSWAGNDILEGGAGNDFLSGGPGINTAVYQGEQADYLIHKGDISHVVDTRSSNGDEGMDTLLGIVRLQFQDVSVAYDMSGNAGQVAKILGAVFGAAMVADQILAGIGLHYLDSGLDYDALMLMAIDARAGVDATDREVVDLLYSNVVGSLPSDEVAQSYIQMLESGVHTRASLGVMAADTALNALNIDLVGLSEPGLLYTEYLI